MSIEASDKPVCYSIEFNRYQLSKSIVNYFPPRLTTCNIHFRFISSWSRKYFIIKNDGLHLSINKELFLAWLMWWHPKNFYELHFVMSDLDFEYARKKLFRVFITCHILVILSITNCWFIIEIAFPLIYRLTSFCIRKFLQNFYSTTISKNVLPLISLTNFIQHWQ